MYLKNEIVEIMKNEERYLEELSNSHGFLLKKTLDLKIEIPNSLLGKIKNTKIGNAYLSSSSKQKKITVHELFNNPTNTESKLDTDNIKLSIGEINSNINKIIELLSDKDNKNHKSLQTIVENSLQNLTIDELLTINTQLFVNNLNLFRKNSKFSDDKSYKELMKNCISQYCENTNTEPSISLYYNYKFNNEDIVFLHELLKINSNKISYLSKLRTYNTLSNKISGMKNLISAEEYVLKYDPLDIPSLPLDSYLGNKEEYNQNVRNYLLNKSSENKITFFEMVVNNEIKLEYFTEIFNSEFIFNYLKENNLPFLFRSINSIHTEEKLQKIIHIFETCLSQPHEILNKIDTYDLIDGYNDIISLFGQYEFQKIKDNKGEHLRAIFNRYFLNYINKSLDTENINKVVDNLKYYIEQDSEERVRLIFENTNPSINLYLAVSKYYNELLLEKKNKSKSVLNSTKTLWDSLNHKLKDDYPNEIKKIQEKIGLTINNHKTLFENSYINKFSKPIDTSKNIFKWNEIPIENINYESIRIIGENIGFNIYEKFLKDIKNVNMNALIEAFLPTYVNEKLLDHNPRIEFLRLFVAQNKTLIDKSPEIIKSIVQSPLQDKIYPIVDLKQQDDDYEKLVSLYKGYNENDNIVCMLKEKYKSEWNSLRIELKENPLPIECKIDVAKNNNLSNKAIKDLINISENNKRYYEMEIDKNQNNLVTHKYIEQKILELLQNNNFEEIDLLRIHNRKYRSHHVMNHINSLNVETIKELSYQKAFCNILKSSVSYDGDTEISFPKMDYTDLKTIIYNIESLSKPDSIKFLNMFKNSQDSLKEYIIEDIPEKVLSVYGFLQFTPPEGRFIKLKTPYLIQSPYTSDQIIKLLENLKNRDLYFSNFDINARCGDNIAQLFTSNSKGENIKDKVEKVLSYCKENNQIAYLLISTDATLLSELYQTKDNLSRSELSHEMFLNHFDLDATKKAITILSDKINSNCFINEADYKKKYNTRLIFGALKSFSYITYFEENFQSDAIKSNLSDKDSKIIAEHLLDKLPLFTISNLKTIGTIKDISNYIANSECSIPTEQLSTKFYISNDTSDFQLDAQYKIDRILKVSEKIINNAFVNKNIGFLEYMHYIMDTYVMSEDYRDENSQNRFKAYEILEFDKYDYSAIRVILENSEIREPLLASISALKLENELDGNKKNTNRKMKI